MQNIFLLSFVTYQYANSLDSVRKNGIEWVKDLGKKNVQDLLTLIQWNEDNVRSLESKPVLICD